jgi:hypothetical protein
MSRRLRRGRLALLALVTLLAASQAHAAEPQPADLLRLYEPVLLFHPDEEWAPERVESYLQVAAVERQEPKGVWTRVPPPLPASTAGCVASPCFRLNLPCKLRSGVACYQEMAETSTDWTHPVVYGTVAQVPTGATPAPGFTEAPRLLVHYWLFYAFDDWRSARKRLWQTHEGDWESITIGIDKNDAPMFAAYSEHCSGTVRSWQAVTRRASTHPVAYVALGSHANWFSSATANTRFGECLTGPVAGTAAKKAARLIGLAQEQIVDRMGSAHPLGPAGLPGVTPLELVELKPAATRWARFPGRWGEGQILWLGSTPRLLTTVSQGSGPATPRWGAATVSASWHPASS